MGKMRGTKIISARISRKLAAALKSYAVLKGYTSTSDVLGALIRDAIDRDAPQLLMSPPPAPEQQEV